MYSGSRLSFGVIFRLPASPEIELVGELDSSETPRFERCQVTEMVRPCLEFAPTPRASTTARPARVDGPQPV